MKQQTIAVIDDDAAMLDMIGTLLTDEGYEVLRWPTAKPAYDLIRQHRPDLVILDLRMEHPQAGWLVIHMLRLDPETASVPVVLCTADTDYVRRQADELHRQGVVALVKPFAADDLVQTVARLLSTTTADPAPHSRDDADRPRSPLRAVLDRMRSIIGWGTRRRRR